jgi:regulator of RNase E activity RraA
LDHGRAPFRAATYIREGDSGMENTVLPPDIIAAFRTLSTCAVANAIETFDVRLRNAGFTDPSITCRFDDLPPVTGYAVTARIRTSLPPMVGHRYTDRTDWWMSIAQVPAPRIVVLEDIDDPPGVGAFVGQVHASILRALGCVGLATNGAVRALPEIHRMGFQCFSKQVAVSHAYAHIFEFGKPVRLGGLRIEPGTLLHGDRHGLVQVPLDIAGRVPAVAAEMSAHDHRIIALCESPRFSIEALRTLIRDDSPDVASDTPTHPADR